MASQSSHTARKHPQLGNEQAIILGMNVERYRCRNHLSKSKFSMMLGIGRPTLNRIERGVNDTRLSLICAMAEALDVDVVTLLTPPEN